jgi:hypothetical protein
VTYLLLFLCHGLSVLFYVKVDKTDVLPAVEETNWVQTNTRCFNSSNSPNK